MIEKVILDAMPEKNYVIEKLENGNTSVVLYRNITEIEVEGVKKYEAEKIGFVRPSFYKATDDSFDTDEKINFYFAKMENLEKQAKVGALVDKLNTIDSKSARALRAIAAGVGTDDDKAKLKELEEQAEVIRKQIQEVK